jgi:tetratricopeptide (TPR) repeat protein
MAATARVILVVDNPNALGTAEDTIQRRLVGPLGCASAVAQDPATPIPAGTDLVVLLTGKAPPGLRDQATPVLVCHPGALYDLGMVTARPNLDFGTVSYSDVFVGADLTGHPLTAGLVGPRTILTGNTVQGWGKASADALVAATVAGDSSKAVAFAYDLGAPMPGRDAAARRSAFLASENAPALFTPSGWLLFDAAVNWALYGGGPARAGSGGGWILQDGAPTRRLSASEYRDWIHDQIEGDLWKRVVRLVSLVGIGGLIPLVGLLYSFYAGFSSSIETSIKKEVATTLVGEQPKLHTQIQHEAETQATMQVAKIIMHDPQSWDKIFAKLNEKAGEALQAKLKEDQIKDMLLATAMKGLYEEGQMADGLLLRFRKAGVDQGPQTRQMTLTLILAFATPPQLQKIRPELMSIIKNPAEGEAVRALALEGYRPAGDAAADGKDLLDVVTAFAGGPSAGVLGQGLTQFVARFPDTYVDEVLRRLMDQVRTPRDGSAPAVLAGLARMPGDPQQPRYLKKMTELAAGTDVIRRPWGVQGLQQLTTVPRLAIADSARLAALETLLKGINVIQALDYQLSPGLTLADPSLTVPTPATVPSQAEGAANEQSMMAKLRNNVIFGLVRRDDVQTKALPTDSQPVLGKWLASGWRADSRGSQALLFNWVQRLALERDPERRKVPPELLDQLYAVNDLLYGDGTTRVIAHALRAGQTDAIETFYKRLPDWYHADQRTAAVGRGEALRAAIEADAGSTPPFRRLIRLLQEISDGAEKTATHAQLKTELGTAINVFYNAPERRLEDVTNLAEALNAPEIGDAGRAGRDYLTPKLDAAYQNFLGRFTFAKRWDLLIEQYSRLIEREPQKPEWRLGRGKVYLQKLRNYKLALADVQAAIELQAASMQAASADAYEARGDTYMKLRKVPEAIQEYGHALQAPVASPKTPKKTPAVPTAPPPASGELYRKLALAYALKDDVANAKTYTDAAVKLLVSNLDKARALEALGIAYLRQGAWKEARANAALAQSWYPMSSWNLLTRYIVARELNEAAEAATALKEWQNSRQPNNLADLDDFIHPLLEKHLQVTDIRPGVLRFDAANPTITRNVHRFDLLAGKTYVIDMESSPVFDAYLIAQDPTGVEIGRDDDSGGGLNARLTLTATKTGSYLIIATSFEGNAQGAYTLIQREPPAR